MIDNFLIIARDYESSEESYYDDEQYISQFQKLSYEDDPYNYMLPKSKSHNQYEQSDEFGAKMQTNGYGMNHRGQQSDNFDMELMNAKDLNKKSMYLNQQNYAWDAQNKQDLSNGPFFINKNPDEVENLFLTTQKEETAQITSALWKIYNEDNGNTFDKNFDNFTTTKLKNTGASVYSTEAATNGR